MSVKDAVGNALQEGDFVHVKVGLEWLEGHIIEIKQGGSILSTARGETKMTAGMVKVKLNAVSVFDPTNPVVLDIYKLTNPKAVKSDPNS